MAQNKKDNQGRKQGHWVKYKDGVKFYEGQFQDNYPIGEFVRYFPSGRVLMKSYYSDKGKRRFTEFYYDKRKSQMKAQGLYLNKKKDSLWLIYNESGVLISEEYYTNDTANGLWKLHDYHGRLLKETPYKYGYIDGIQNEYFENGSLKRVITFTMDSLNGPMDIYYPSGEKRVEAYYKMGIPVKTWNYYDEDGGILFTERYEKGEMKERLNASGAPVKMEIEQDTVHLDIDPSEIDFDR